MAGKVASKYFLCFFEKKKDRRACKLVRPRKENEMAKQAEKNNDAYSISSRALAKQKYWAMCVFKRAGYSKQEIAEAFGVSEQRVYQILKKYGSEYIATNRDELSNDLNIAMQIQDAVLKEIENKTAPESAKNDAPSSEDSPVDGYQKYLEKIEEGAPVIFDAQHNIIGAPALEVILNRAVKEANNWGYSVSIRAKFVDNKSHDHYFGSIGNI